MGKFNGKDATIWMRGLKPHTYEQKPQDEGSFYLAHEEMVDTIEALGFARREAPPKRPTGTPIPLESDATIPTAHPQTHESRIPVQPAPFHAAPVAEQNIKAPRSRRANKRDTKP